MKTNKETTDQNIPEPIPVLWSVAIVILGIAVMLGIGWLMYSPKFF